MSTQMHRIAIVLMVAVMFGLVAAGWFLVAQPQLAAASASADQIASAQSQISASQASLVQLRAQKSKLPELTSRLATLQRSIPSTLASSPLLLGFDQEAAAAGVVITNITVNDAATYAPTGATASSGAAAGTPSPSPSATPSPSPSATAPASSSATGTGTGGFTPKTDPRITAANFVPVPVSITVTGNWDQTLAFVKNLQTGDRLYAIGTVGLKHDDPTAANSGPDGYSTVVTGFIFAITDPATAPATAAAGAGSK